LSPFPDVLGTAFATSACTSGAPFFPALAIACCNPPRLSPSAGGTKDSLWPNPKGLLKVAGAESIPLASPAGVSSPAMRSSTIPLVLGFFFPNILIIMVMETTTPNR
jgi:hypothetical protein